MISSSRSTTAILLAICLQHESEAFRIVPTIGSNQIPSCSARGSRSPARDSAGRRPFDTKSNLQPPSTSLVTLFAGEDRAGKEEEEEVDEEGFIKKNFVESIFDPIPTRIPRALREEIIQAENNTPAGKARANRVLIYGVLAFFLLNSTFLNGFITQLRADVLTETGVEGSLSDIGWGWTESNIVFRTLFLTKIGGALTLLAGGGLGILAESEYTQSKENAELIYREMLRRRDLREAKERKKEKKGGRRKGGGVSQPQPASASSSQSSGKMSRRQRKRLAALSEVTGESSSPETTSTKEGTGATVGHIAPVEGVAATTETLQDSQEHGEGILGKLQEWFDTADSMAASQALLLNKELEERGILKKITDETGLKVIGEEAAAKLTEDKNEVSTKEQKQDKAEP